jgi:uncharacterized protein YbjT (DUF2867 family)
MDNFDTPILVIGGTGKTGGRLVSRLTRRDIPVRVGSRTAGVPFDWTEPATWVPALDGVRAAYIAYHPDLAAPGATDAIRELTRLAVDRGVRRLVLLSGRGEEEAQACERVLAESGADWTVLRCSWFNQNFDEGYLVEPILAGEVALPAGDVGEPFLDADDIADVAATVLTEPGHTGQVYELTGPRLLTFADAVATIAAATGREVRYVEVTPEEYATEVPPELADFMTYLFTTVLDGRNASLGDGVQRVLDRAPRDFADYAEATATTGIWTPGGAR